MQGKSVPGTSNRFVELAPTVEVQVGDITRRLQVLDDDLQRIICGMRAKDPRAVAQLYFFAVTFHQELARMTQQTAGGDLEQPATP